MKIQWETEGYKGEERERERGIRPGAREREGERERGGWGEQCIVSDRTTHISQNVLKLVWEDDWARERKSLKKVVAYILFHRQSVTLIKPTHQNIKRSCLTKRLSLDASHSASSCWGQPVSANEGWDGYRFCWTFYHYLNTIKKPVNVIFYKHFSKLL